MGGVPAVVDVTSVSSLEFVGSVTHNLGDLVGSEERSLEELAIMDGESGCLSPEASGFVFVFWEFFAGQVAHDGSHP